jgi:hypothetical protein
MRLPIEHAEHPLASHGQYARAVAPTALAVRRASSPTVMSRQWYERFSTASEWLG